MTRNRIVISSRQMVRYKCVASSNFSRRYHYLGRYHIKRRSALSQTSRMPRYAAFSARRIIAGVMPTRDASHAVERAAARLASFSIGKMAKALPELRLIDVDAPESVAAASMPSRSMINAEQITARLFEPARLTLSRATAFPTLAIGRRLRQYSSRQQRRRAV